MGCYREILSSELLRRQRTNPAYSMRSFARDIGLSQSYLSQVMSKKRKLSDEAGLQIADRLKLRGSRRALFANLVRLELLSNEEAKSSLSREVEKLRKKQTRFQPLSEDVFNAVSNWFYFAIVELTELKGFKNDAQWIARKLRIPAQQAKTAIERLTRLGLLRLQNGSLIKTERDYIFENVPSSAIRNHHRETLQLAQRALGEQRLNEREFFTVVLPMDPAKIGEAKRRIRAFSEELTAEMQGSEAKSIYKLAIQLFRLDQGDVQ